MKPTIEQNRQKKQATNLFKHSSTNKRKRPHSPENEEEKRNSAPLKKPKKDDSDHTPAKVETRTRRSPSSSTPDSCITQKPINSLVPDGGVSRNLNFDDEAASPEKKLIQHLTTLSEIMEPSLKGTSQLVFDLLTDSKFREACMDVAGGMKLLKEGLKTITKARQLLCMRKDGK